MFLCILLKLLMNLLVHSLMEKMPAVREAVLKND